MELSLEEKIKVLEWVLEGLEARIGLGYLCHNVKFGIEKALHRHWGHVARFHATEYIPELLEFKPEGKGINESWWPGEDCDTRISVVKTVLQTLYKKYANGASN